MRHKTATRLPSFRMVAAIALLSVCLIPGLAYATNENSAHAPSAEQVSASYSNVDEGVVIEDTAEGSQDEALEAVNSEYADEADALEPESLIPGWNKLNDGTWCYGLEDKTAKTGWLKDAGRWYWLDPAEGGRMATGLREIGGASYHFAASGEMSVGWAKEAGAWYYAAESGTLVTGWLEDAGRWYWLADDGSMQTGWLEDAGKSYWLKASGAMACDEWEEVDGDWYHFAAGGYAETGWIEDAGKSYWLDPIENGRMASGLFEVGGEWFTSDDNGVVRINCWSLVDGFWYRCGSRGETLTGWYESGAKKYWLDPGAYGAMATGLICVDGFDYFAEENGVIATGAWIEKDGRILLAGTDGTLQEEAYRNSEGGLILKNSDGDVLVGWQHV